MMLNVGANKDPSPMEDGGGLCSPGRWKIAQRRLPEELGARVSRKLLLVLEHWGARKFGGLRGLCYQLASNKLQESPFPAMVMRQLKDIVRNELKAIRKERGIPEPSRAPAKKQWIDVRLVQEVLEVAEDPDHKIMNAYAVGVRVGWRRKLPRTPAVFRRKNSWRLRGDVDDAEVCFPDNYSSSMDRKEGLLQQLEEDEEEGFVTRMTLKEARSRWPESLRIAAMAQWSNQDAIGATRTTPLMEFR